VGVTIITNKEEIVRYERDSKKYLTIMNVSSTSKHIWFKRKIDNFFRYKIKFPLSYVLGLTKFNVGMEGIKISCKYDKQ